MPSLSSFLSAADPAEIAIVNVADRALLAYRRILDRPTTITVKGATAQVVRVEYHDLSHEEDGQVQTAGVSQATVFGVKGHPTVPDTVIDRGDRFVVDGSILEVVALMLPPGEVQALCEVRDG